MVRFEDDGESGVDALVGLRKVYSNDLSWVFRNCVECNLRVFRGVVFSVVGLSTGRVGDGEVPASAIANHLARNSARVHETLASANDVAHEAIGNVRTLRVIIWIRGESMV